MAKPQKHLIKKQVFIYQNCYEHVKSHREFLVDKSLGNERTYVLQVCSCSVLIRAEQELL